MNFGSDGAPGRFSAVRRLAIVRIVGAAARLFAPVQLSYGIILYT